MLFYPDLVLFSKISLLTNLDKGILSFKYILLKGDFESAYKNFSSLSFV